MLISRPGLREVISVVEEVQSLPNLTRIVMEGLLDHFFSPIRPNYFESDVIYFLELANDKSKVKV